jgi:hypothetical protein
MAARSEAGSGSAADSEGGGADAEAEVCARGGRPHVPLHDAAAVASSTNAPPSRHDVAAALRVHGRVLRRACATRTQELLEAVVALKQLQAENAQLTTNFDNVRMGGQTWRPQDFTRTSCVRRNPRLRHVCCVMNIASSGLPPACTAQGHTPGADQQLPAAGGQLQQPAGRAGEPQENNRHVCHRRQLPAVSCAQSLLHAAAALCVRSTYVCGIMPGRANRWLWSSNTSSCVKPGRRSWTTSSASLRRRARRSWSQGVWRRGGRGCGCVVRWRTEGGLLCAQQQASARPCVKVPACCGGVLECGARTRCWAGCARSDLSLLRAQLLEEVEAPFKRQCDTIAKVCSHHDACEVLGLSASGCSHTRLMWLHKLCGCRRPRQRRSSMWRCGASMRRCTAASRGR